MSNPAQGDSNESPPRALEPAARGEANASAPDAPRLPIEDVIAGEASGGDAREFIGELVDVRDELSDVLDDE